MNTHIVSIYAAVIALLLIFLAYRVSARRVRFKVGIGAESHRELEVAIRAHANAVEYAPITLLLMLLLELAQWSPLLLHGAGGALVISRVSHAWGLIHTHGNASPFRFYGILLNWLLIVLLSAANVANFFSLHF